MCKMAELDWETRLDEQMEMENDEHYINWLNKYNESFTLETEFWYGQQLYTDLNKGIKSGR